MIYGVFKVKEFIEDIFNSKKIIGKMFFDQIGRQKNVRRRRPRNHGLVTIYQILMCKIWSRGFSRSRNSMKTYSIPKKLLERCFSTKMAAKKNGPLRRPRNHDLVTIYQILMCKLWSRGFSRSRNSMMTY